MEPLWAARSPKILVPATRLPHGAKLASNVTQHKGWCRDNFITFSHGKHYSPATSHHQPLLQDNIIQVILYLQSKIRQEKYTAMLYNDSLLSSDLIYLQMKVSQFYLVIKLYWFINNNLTCCCCVWPRGLTRKDQRCHPSVRGILENWLENTSSDYAGSSLFQIQIGNKKLYFLKAKMAGVRCEVCVPKC